MELCRGKGLEGTVPDYPRSLGGGNRSLYFCHYFLYFNIFLIFYTKHSFYCAKLLCMKLCVETSVVSLVAEGRGRAEEPHPPSGFLSSTLPLEVARVNSKAIHYAPREIPYSLYFTINSFIEGTVT